MNVYPAIKNINILICLVLFYTFSNAVAAQPPTCTYQTYKWNVKEKSAVKIKQVKHSYSSVRDFEIDSATGCSVCREDQISIKLPGIKVFSICKYIADDVKRKLYGLINSGVKINSITGYRVGMTRGQLDDSYNRTQFSNHSFGIALDINPDQNGLYDHCIQFNPSCRLIRGGPWKPGYIGSLMKDGPVVTELEQIGLRWGGLIQGKQKDFMHFSPSGY